jgi:hypothetical protein
MVTVRRVLRWVGAVVVGVVAYVIAFAIGFFMWQQFGGGLAGASRWILAAATFCAVLAGAFTAARDARKTAALALWALALLLPVVLMIKNAFDGHFTAMNLFEVAGTLIGGLPAYYAVHIAPLSTLKAEDEQPASH